LIDFFFWTEKFRLKRLRFWFRLVLTHTYIYLPTLDTLFSLSYNTRERQHHTLAASLSLSGIFSLFNFSSLLSFSYLFSLLLFRSVLVFSSHFFQLRFYSDLNCFCIYFILFLLDLISVVIFCLNLCSYVDFFV